jgi:ankyrin repeat protein
VALKALDNVAQLLLANKAEANAKNHYDATPLHAAAFTGREGVVQPLLPN